MAIPAAQLRAKAALIQPRARLEVTLRRVFGPDYRMGFLFVAPIVVLVLSLVAYPFCYAVYLSMTRKYVGVPPVWVGFENYVRLTYDGFFQRAVVNSFTFTFASVAVKTVLGMGMALVLTSLPAMYASLLCGSVHAMTPGGWILCFWIVSTAN